MYQIESANLSEKLGMWYLIWGPFYYVPPLYKQ